MASQDRYTIKERFIGPFIFFAIFRAFYGMGILIVTYFISTNKNNSIITTIGFLIFSMIFSRVLFSKIKKN